MQHALRNGSAQTTARARCHTETETADQTFCLRHSLYTDTGPTSPSADPITSDAWQGQPLEYQFEVTDMTRPRKRATAKAGIEPMSAALEAADTLPLGQRGGVTEEEKQTEFKLTSPTVLLTPPAGKAADMAHLCAPENPVLGVCRGFVPDIQVCGTHGREDLVNATITLNAEEEKEAGAMGRL